MRFKVKAFIGFYQCLCVIPRIYEVRIPDALEMYTDWVRILEFPSEIGMDLLIPGSCYGSYRRSACPEQASLEGSRMAR
jgi:hypothetical protein